MFRFRKKSTLQHYQDRMVALLYSGAAPQPNQQVLLTDKKLAGYWPYIRNTTPPMIQTAGALVRQWGKMRQQIHRKV